MQYKTERIKLETEHTTPLMEPMPSFTPSSSGKQITKTIRSLRHRLWAHYHDGKQERGYVGGHSLT